MKMCDTETEMADACFETVMATSRICANLRLV
jgi:hypothetical protein